MIYSASFASITSFNIQFSNQNFERQMLQYNWNHKLKCAFCLCHESIHFLYTLNGRVFPLNFELTGVVQCRTQETNILGVKLYAENHTSSNCSTATKFLQLFSNRSYVWFCFEMNSTAENTSKQMWPEYVALCCQKFVFSIELVFASSASSLSNSFDQCFTLYSLLWKVVLYILLEFLHAQEQKKSEALLKS